MADERNGEAPPHSPPAPSSEAKRAEPSGRPKRSSVRPSAFGPPRASGREPAPLAEPADGGAFEDSSDSLDELDPYELTPSPGALEELPAGVYPEASSDSSDGWTPLGTRQNVFPTLGYDPFRSPDSQPAPPSDPDSEEVSVPTFPSREFEETEVTSPSLVAARSGLLPIPEAPTEAPSVAPAEEAGVSSLAIALFVLMLLGAGGVLVATWPREQAAYPPHAAPARPRPVPRAASGPEPAAVPTVRAPQPVPGDRPRDILARIEPGLPERPEAAADKLLAYARSYLEEERPEVAALLLTHAVSLDEDNGDVLLALGGLSLTGGDLEAAERHASRAVEAAPRSVEARLLLGDVYAQQGMQGRARRHYRRAERLDPGSAAVRERLGAKESAAATEEGRAATATESRGAGASTGSAAPAAPAADVP